MGDVEAEVETTETAATAGTSAATAVEAEIEATVEAEVVGEAETSTIARIATLTAVNPTPTTWVER